MPHLTAGPAFHRVAYRSDCSVASLPWPRWCRFGTWPDDLGYSMPFQRRTTACGTIGCWQNLTASAGRNIVTMAG
jgi:hypothetical protein